MLGNTVLRILYNNTHMLYAANEGVTTSQVPGMLTSGKVCLLTLQAAFDAINRKVYVQV